MTDESIFFPSPNWFSTVVLCTAPDGWVIYGAPAKGICILRPSAKVSSLLASPSYRVHLIPWAHRERVSCTVLSPLWETKRIFASAADDGFVKLWDAETQTNIIAHNAHASQHDKVCGVDFASDSILVSIGTKGVVVTWDIKLNVTRSFNNLLRNVDPICFACCRHNPTLVTVGTRQGYIVILSLKGEGKVLKKFRGHDSTIQSISWCPVADVTVQKQVAVLVAKTPITTPSQVEAKIDRSVEGRRLNLDESIRSTEGPCGDDAPPPDDDIFDIYQEPEDTEFGHKKYQPEEIVVKSKKNKRNGDFMSECLKLKNDILLLQSPESDSKGEMLEADVNSLSDMMESTGLNGTPKSRFSKCGTSSSDADKSFGEEMNEKEEVSSNTYGYLFASKCQQGKLCIWDSAGKLVASHKGQKHTSAALYWHSKEVLLFSDSNHALHECNPTWLNSKNSFSTNLIHSLHKKGITGISSTSLRKQPNDCLELKDDYQIVSSSMDRRLVRCSYPGKQVVGNYASFGGYVYMLTTSPIDPTKVAIAIGDGTIVVWEMEVNDEGKLDIGNVTMHRPAFQTKTFCAHWHSTKENMLAFGTSEGRIGLRNTNDSTDKPARYLPTVINKGVYSMCWGEEMNLYACGSGQLYLYNAKTTDKDPEQVNVTFEGKTWKIGCVQWTEDYLAVGSLDGEVGLLTSSYPHQLLTVSIPLKKQIQTINWHPKGVSDGEAISPHANWAAVSSTEHHFVVMAVQSTEDGVKMEVVATLKGHTSNVLKLAWSPHHEARIVSVSQDGLIHVWDVIAQQIISTYAGHDATVLTAMWSPLPEQPDYIFSGGTDFCVRMWSIKDHKPGQFTSKEKLKKAKLAKQALNTVTLAMSTIARAKEPKQGNFVTEDVRSDIEAHNLAIASDGVSKRISKGFLFPVTNKQQNKMLMNGVRRLFNQYLVRNGHESVEEQDEIKAYDLDYLGIYGGRSEILELMQMEQDSHLLTLNYEAWTVLSMLKGETENVIRFATERNELNPFHIYLAPSISHRFWKETMNAYIVQTERESIQEAAGKPKKVEFKGVINNCLLRRVVAMLCIHDVMKAIDALVEGKLFREAIALARVCCMDSVAEKILLQWAEKSALDGQFAKAAECYITLGKLMEASLILGKSNDEHHMSLAAKIAKFTGQNVYAESMEKRSGQIDKDRLLNNSA